MAAICERRGHSPPSHEYEAIFDRVNRGLFEIYDHCLAQGIPWCKIRPGLWEASEEEIQIPMVLGKGTAPKDMNRGMASKPKPVPPMKPKPQIPKKEMPQKRPPPSSVDIDIASGPPSPETPPARKVLPPPVRKAAPPYPKDPRVSSTPLSWTWSCFASRIDFQPQLQWLQKQLEGPNHLPIHHQVGEEVLFEVLLDQKNLPIHRQVIFPMSRNFRFLQKRTGGIRYQGLWQWTWSQ